MKKMFESDHLIATLEFPTQWYKETFKNVKSYVILEKVIRWNPHLNKR